MLAIFTTPDHAAASGTAHQFSFTSIDGNPVSLGDFAGKAVLVVNTASKCGFTRQYADIQTLWERYRDRGLIVLGVPSNDFGGQEPGAAGEIKRFCELTFGIDFPLMDKSKVKGPDAHPFYVWAAEQLGAMAKPRWNFHKYLIDREGRLVDWFSTPTSPLSDEMIAAVERTLIAPD
ncbi:MAG: glutathione peroxidase [Rhodospirillales bacterium]